MIILVPIFLLNLIIGTIAEIPCIIPAEIIFLGADSAPVLPTFFHLYTRKNPYYPQNFTFTSCTENTYLNPQLKTVIISHGLKGSAYGEHIIFLKTAYLHYEDCNVLIIDWSVAAGKFYFPNAMRNALTTGKYVAEQLKLWKQNCKELNFENFHIIGFSLGGQMAGFIGKFMKEKVGRITALDPSGICFAFFPPKFKLHYTDAKFVDVISVSTSSQFILAQPTGHVHFYPDGGLIRRGCADELVELDIGSVYGCTHLGTVHLFASTLYSECLPVGYQCKDENTFNKGECSDCGSDGKQCAAMGIHANRYADKITNKTATMYLVTTFTDEQCLYQYQIKVTLASNADSTTEIGKLALVINNGTVNAVLNKDLYLQHITEKLQPGKTYTYLISTTHNIDQINQLEFLWYSTRPRIDSKLYVQCVKIVPMNNLETDRSSLITFGTTNGEAIPPHDIILMNTGTSC